MNDLTLMVCPHDAVRSPEGWRGLGRHMATRLDTEISVAISHDFTAFRQAIGAADLVYGSPSDSLTLLDIHGFCPLARPADTYDEALLIAGPEGDLPAIEAIHHATVATVTHLLPTRLALRLLREHGISPATLAHRDSWLSVVRSVWNGETPFGFLYRDAYEELSPRGREMIRIIEATDRRAAFHMLSARPGICEAMAPLTSDLAAMGATPDGRILLSALGISGWLPMSRDDLAPLRELMAFDLTW